jgi:large subunit ribosomal protein L5e
MGFVKIVKNKAYSKRMQVKPKRRRQGKTDYYARRRLVQQDKNKYDSKKYRLVVRRTNTKIIAQIIFSTMTGDRVFCAAESTELKAHGLTAGLTNYSASYSTGLLLARRLLKQVGLDTLYATNSAVDGEYYNTEENVQDKRPFKALLDVGIQRTTTGARLFGVLKGACDGGINVPHNTKRFPGYTRAQLKQILNKRGKTTGETEQVECSFDAKAHRARIYGNHVTIYMNLLKKENAAKFKIQFSNWEKCLTDTKSKTCEDLYKKVHAAIVANPVRATAAAKKVGARKVIDAKPQLVQQDTKGRKWLRHFRLTKDQRQEKVNLKFKTAMEQNLNN